LSWHAARTGKLTRAGRAVAERAGAVEGEVLVAGLVWAVTAGLAVAGWAEWCSPDRSTRLCKRTQRR
jgi:hypothetical protein